MVEAYARVFRFHIPLLFSDKDMHQNFKRREIDGPKLKKCNAEGDTKPWLAFLWFVLVLAQFQLALRPTVPLRRSLATLDQHDCKYHYPVDKNNPRLRGSVHETVPRKEHTKLSAMRNELITKEIGLGTSDVSFAATT
jgi:hypothetical protein